MSEAVRESPAAVNAAVCCKLEHLLTAAAACSGWLPSQGRCDSILYCSAGADLSCYWVYNADTQSSTVSLHGVCLLLPVHHNRSWLRRYCCMAGSDTIPGVPLTQQHRRTHGPRWSRIRVPSRDHGTDASHCETEDGVLCLCHVLLQMKGCQAAGCHAMYTVTSMSRKQCC